MTELRIGVVGAGGYAGQELIRWLTPHPEAEVTLVVLRTGQDGRAGSAWPPANWSPPMARAASYIPVLRGFDPDVIAERCDIVFLALPGGASAPLALELRKREVTVIDIGGDLRLRDYDAYAKWYGGESPLDRNEHAALQQDVVYGLPEWTSEALRGAVLVSLPGCYPTAALLLLVPLLKDGWASSDGMALSAASGITGSGNTPGRAGLFADLSENFHPYKTGRHQHLPEIEQALATLANVEARISWTTHLLPIRRGLFVTAFLVPGSEDPHKAQEALAKAYADSRLVDVSGDEPETSWVLGSPRAALALHWDEHAGRLIGYCAIDNLCKGASTQAIQAMNIVAGLPETTGLDLFFGGVPQ